MLQSRALAQLHCFIPGLASDAGLSSRAPLLDFDSGARLSFSIVWLLSVPAPPEFVVGDQHQDLEALCNIYERPGHVRRFHLVLRDAAILAGVPGDTAEGDRGIKRVWKSVIQLALPGPVLIQ